MSKGKFEVYKDSSGQYRFRLKAPNGEIIAIGEAYTTKSSCLEGVKNVKKYSPEAEVVDIT